MALKVEHINPFIESVYELFSTMLGSEATRGEIGIFKGDASPHEITALIGLSGMARGTVALSFPTQTALAMVGRLLDAPQLIVDATVSDGVAELVNIVAGNAKAKLSSDTETPIELSLPTVVRGANYKVDYPSNTMWIEIPFTSDLGAFSLRITFHVKEVAEGAKTMNQDELADTPE